MTTEATTLADVLSQHTREGTLYEGLAENNVRCFSCGHRCFIPEGAVGICKVRFNLQGTLMVPWGYVGALQCDPIEKKPFFHALPDTCWISIRTSASSTSTDTTWTPYFRCSRAGARHTEEQMTAPA